MGDAENCPGCFGKRRLKVESVYNSECLQLNEFIAEGEKVNLSVAVTTVVTSIFSVI